MWHSTGTNRTRYKIHKDKMKKYLEKLEEDKKELLREWYSLKLPEDEVKWLVLKSRLTQVEDYISRYKRGLL